MSDIDDGSDKPIGHQTDDGELEVREVDGERGYHETALGQNNRWIRQAPDLYARHLLCVEALADALLFLRNDSPDQRDKLTLEQRIAKILGG